MKESLPQENTGALSALQRIDAFCDHFEEAWQKAEHPRIEDYLANVPEAERAALLPQLLKVELELRYKAHETIALEVYLERFQAYADVILSVVNKCLSITNSPLPNSSSRPSLRRSDEVDQHPGRGQVRPSRRSWLVGDRIEDRWTIQRILKGGMGIVYIVHDEESHEYFAAKTYRENVLAQSEIGDRFRQEALTWTRLDAHPNIVRAKFVKIIEGKPILFLEYIKGGDLQSWLPRLQVYSEGKRSNSYYDRLKQIRDFAIQFCDGMIHASSKGITAHRDIKPSNCLVGLGDSGNVLKITDFGLAKALDAATGLDDSLTTGDLNSESYGPFAGKETALVSPNCQGLKLIVTRTGVGAGTPAYMAPEQFDDIKRVDVRADIYSFGVMLFQLITGELPFDCRNWPTYKRAHQTKAPPVLVVHVWKELRGVVQTCLAKNPEDRFADFRALRDALWLASGYDPFETYLDRAAVARPDDLKVEDLMIKAKSLTMLGQIHEALAVGKLARSMTSWEYTDDNRHRLGPVTFHRLREMAASREIQPTDMIHQVGAQKWIAVRYINLLRWHQGTNQAEVRQDM